MKMSKKEAKKNYEEKEIGGITMRIYESGFAPISIQLGDADNKLIINGSIRQSKNGNYFYSFPSYKDKEGNYQNQAYVMGDKAKADIQALVDALVE